MATVIKSKSKMELSKKPVSLSQVKVGDKIVFNNKKEKLTLTITKITKSSSGADIECRWKNQEALIFDDDFKNGFVRKYIKKSK